jgi:hypothetical protein
MFCVVELVKAASVCVCPFHNFSAAASWQLSRYSDWLRAGRSGVRMPEAAKKIIFSKSPRPAPGPIQLPLGDGVLFQNKAAGAWSWPQLPYMPSRLVQEQLYLLFIIIITTTIRHQLGLDRPVSASSNTDMRRSTTEIRSEKCVVRRFRRLRTS